MLANFGLAAVLLVALACNAAAAAAPVQAASVTHRLIALNPQPLPPGDERDPFGDDFG